MGHVTLRASGAFRAMVLAETGALAAWRRGGGESQADLSPYFGAQTLVHLPRHLKLFKVRDRMLPPGLVKILECAGEAVRFHAVQQNLTGIAGSQAPLPRRGSPSAPACLQLDEVWRGLALEQRPTPERWVREEWRGRCAAG